MWLLKSWLFLCAEVVSRTKNIGFDDNNKNGRGEKSKNETVQANKYGVRGGNEGGDKVGI